MSPYVLLLGGGLLFLLSRGGSRSCSAKFFTVNAQGVQTLQSTPPTEKAFEHLDEYAVHHVEYASIAGVNGKRIMLERKRHEAGSTPTRIQVSNAINDIETEAGRISGSSQIFVEICSFGAMLEGQGPSQLDIFVMPPGSAKTVASKGSSYALVLDT